jgi:hypothetical protein
MEGVKMLKSAFCALLFIGSAVAQGQAAHKVAAPGPTGLEVMDATKSKVELAWTAFPGATAYVVERRAESGVYAAVGEKTTDLVFTDAKIDPYTIYTYHVKAVMGPQKFSGFSNEVKAGPPPTGFNVVTLTPKGREPDFGYDMTTVLDSNEDPVFAYIFRDPNNVNKPADSQLFFGGWDRTNYRWRDPVLVDMIGDFHRDVPRAVALAMDASTGEFGVAYVRINGDREIALSSNAGKTWTRQALPPTPGHEAQGCTLVMGSGNIYLATFSNKGPAYFTGNASDRATKWTQTHVPIPADMNYRANGHLALDGDGKPALVYAAEGKHGYNVSAMYWRPGKDPVKAMDTNNIQNDVFDVRLGFQGNKPSVVVAGYRSTNYDNQLWISSSDDGAKWTDPVWIAKDGNRGMTSPLSLAISGKGEYVLLARDNGGNDKGVKCGYPKVARSADGVHWASCSPTGGPKPAHLSGDATGAFPGNSRLYIGYRSYATQGPLPDGIIVWRESGTAAGNAAINK